MEHTRWKFANVSVRGSSHKKVGRQCDDYSMTVSNPEVTLAVVSDGAGGHCDTHFGSKAICESFVEVITENEALLEEGTAQPILTEVLARAQQNINILENPAMLSATISAICIYKNALYSFQVGDGCIFTDHGGYFSQLLECQRGEFANETVFLNSKHAIENAHFAALDAATINHVVLITDGLRNIFFYQGDLRLTAINVFLDEFKDNGDLFIKELESFLASDFVSHFTDDDLTLVLGYKTQG